VPASATAHVVEKEQGQFTGAYAPLFEMLVLGGNLAGNPVDILDKVTDKAKKAGETLEDKMKESARQVKDKVLHTKPLMDKINAIRAHMCWNRRNLAEHKPCLKFLGVVCEKSSTGDGICSKLQQLAEKQCDSYCVKHDCSQELKELLCGLKDKLRQDEAPTPAPESADTAPESASIAEDEDAQKLEKNGDKNSDSDLDGDGIPDHEDPDIDGDGVENGDDAFPKDPLEHADTDGDGIGDNTDPDIDGDGIPNEEDAFPLDAEEWGDLDGDGIGDNSDPDIDGDGIPNEEDGFPRDDKEWADSDGDGVGDNSDDFPHNPDCSDDSKPPCDTLEVDEDAPGFDSTGVDKVEKPLPSSGYTDVDRGPLVEHDDQQTYTGDWLDEWPRHAEELSKESVSRICKKHPENDWCRRHAEK